MRCDVVAVRVLLTAMCCFGARGLAAQQPAASAPARASAAFEALLEGMACRQQKSGRMDCEFRVGNSVRFVVAGVGQEDVTISFTQADSNAVYVASIVPLHGCIVVKPTRTDAATRVAGIPVSDSVATFAFVSPRTGKVYRNWASCLSATRSDAPRADASNPDGRPDPARASAARQDSIARFARATAIQDSVAKAARTDSLKRAGAAQKAPTARPPS